MTSNRVGFSHLTADLHGITPARLRDGSLVGGLLVAAAGAAGIATTGAPIIRKSNDDGIAAMLLLDGCHITVHTFPSRGLLLLDVLASSAQHVSRALDVFARRLQCDAVQSTTSTRGEGPSAGS